MKKLLSILSLMLMAVPAVHAWTYSGTDATTTHSAQLRVGAEFTKKWENGLHLSIEEELRMGMVDNTTTASTGTTVLSGPHFDRSYTTLALSYKHRDFPYLKVDAGYTLKLMNKDTLALSKIMRHRLFVSLTGSYRHERWSFSLRERLLTEIRMGDIDYHEASGCYQNNRADVGLRSKFEVAYHAMAKPIKPYVWCELINTLNANALQQKYANNDPTQKGHQYISGVRAAAGLSWKINKRNSLNFYYRFNYGYDRDVNVKNKKQTVYLTEQTEYQHVLGIAYHFGW